MRVLVSVLVVVPVVLIASCGAPRGEGAASAADSTAVSGAPPVAAADTARPDTVGGGAADTTRPTAARPAGAAAPKAPAQAPYIGRDSAFGPTFTVDSTGKVTPIEKKKP